MIKASVDEKDSFLPYNASRLVAMSPGRSQGQSRALCARDWEITRETFPDSFSGADRLYLDCLITLAVRHRRIASAYTPRGRAREILFERKARSQLINFPELLQPRRVKRHSIAGNTVSRFKRKCDYVKLQRTNAPAMTPEDCRAKVTLGHFKANRS